MRTLLAALIIAPAATATKPAPKPSAKPAGAKPAAAKPVPKPMAFSPQEFDLAPGETYPVELFVASSSGKATQAKLTFEAGDGVSVTPDSRWSGKTPAWGVKTFPKITAARTAAGDIPLTAKLEKGGEAKLTVRVASPEIEVTPGQQQFTVKLVNPFRKRILNGKIKASNPDRFLQDVTTREFKIAPGETGEVVFPLPGAAPAEGESYDFNLVIETYQGYKLEKTYPLSFPAQDEK